MPDHENLADQSTPDDKPVATTIPKTVLPSVRKKRDKKQVDSTERPHWTDILVAVFTVFIFGTYLASNYFLWKQMRLTSGQLDQMKSGSVQTDKLIGEIHTLAENATKQADAAKTLSDASIEQVKMLGAMVTTANEHTAAVGRQLSIMHAQLEATDRPWISVEVTPGGALTFDKDGTGRLSFTVLMKNLGRSVANFVDSRVGVMAVSPFQQLPPTVIEKQRIMCSQTRPPMQIEPRFAIFPGDTKHNGFSTSFETSRVPDAPADLHLRRGKPLIVLLYGCVDYQFAASHHQTGFTYEIRADKPPQGIQVGNDVLTDRIVFRPYAFAGDYAN